ncbi:MAG: D-glycero-beta-D-manno-heptose 1-phosphate adenylyltransferase [Candidatus Cloacimonetes bacterium]|nr:D-glycero-beta-D-manno-heptose 1-phosphate adenylyltransferase [Candidatus Cloacimonadota bacterium]
MKDKIHNREELQLICRKQQKEGKKVVFTNGCFDILHKGHVLYLQEARELGDVLVIGLNSDASVKRIKGNSRPVNSENDRAVVLSALQMVDFVTIFEEDTPYELIKALQPDILVKGGDWQPEEIVGSDIVLARKGKVISLNYYAGYSTTEIIKKTKA